jgi:hypothetical protein
MAKIDSQTTVTASGQTSGTCSVSGPYKSSTTPSVTIFVKKGQPFPLAPASGSTTGQTATWTMVSETTVITAE